MEDLLGVILCGGESTRMGMDKGLLPIQDTIWAKHVANKLSSFNIPVIYSINQSQYPKYALTLSAQQLLIDNVRAGGPLKGLLSVHRKFLHKNLLLLSCDMLDIDEKTIATILQEYHDGNTYDFIAFSDRDFFQPFCGLYTFVGLHKVYKKMRANELTNFSLQSLLQNGLTKEIKLEDSRPLKSYNNKDEAADL